ncbi:hypothetical protein AM598_03100, partial [Paenibacillus polymyxa]
CFKSVIHFFTQKMHAIKQLAFFRAMFDDKPSSQYLTYQLIYQVLYTLTKNIQALRQVYIYKSYNQKKMLKLNE